VDGLLFKERSWSSFQRALTWDYLDAIEHTVGSFASGQITLTLAGREHKPSFSDQLRATPLNAIGSRTIVEYDDFLEGVEKYPLKNILRYHLNDGSRVIIRPSGTEPKLKIYMDSEGETRFDANSKIASLEIDLWRLVESFA
jgi:phosphomannomutase